MTNEPTPHDSSDNELPPNIEAMIQRSFERIDDRNRYGGYTGFETSDYLSQSPLEDVFWDYARKTDPDGWLEVQAQWKVGEYVADAMFRTSRGITLVELDGKAYHDRGRDLIRDLRIMEMAKEVHQVIRIPYAAMMFSSRAVFSVLAFWEPSFHIPPDLFVSDAARFFDNELPLPGNCDYAGHQSWFNDATNQFELYLIDEACGRFAWVGEPKAFVMGHRSDPIRRITALQSEDPRDEISAQIAIRSELTWPLVIRFQKWIESWES